MVKINNEYYDINLISIIEELRNQLALDGIYLFGQIKELPDDIMITCPFHKDGKERKPSCGIRKSDGWVHCFSCGESCSLEQLISRCYGHDDLGQYGIRWLRKNIVININKREVLAGMHFGRNIKKEEINYISDEELDKFRYYHPYMYKRKLTNEVIDKFDIGYDKETDCITFPVRDKYGRCLFIARRSVKTKFFNYPTNVEKPVYGLYELPKDCEEVIICESMLNALTCYVYGRPAVALNGTGTKYQIEQLKHINCRKLILGLDPDEAGQKGCEKLKHYLKPYKIVTQLVIPKGKDINDLSEKEFKKLLEIF